MSFTREMTGRQKDKVGLKRYGVWGSDMETLIEAKVVRATEFKDGKGTVMVSNYLFTSDDNGDTWTGPHIGKPDLDSFFKRYRIIPEWIAPLKK